MVGTQWGSPDTADVCLPYKTSQSPVLLLCGFLVFVFYSAIKKDLKTFFNMSVRWRGPRDFGQRSWEPDSQNSVPTTHLCLK